MAGLSQEELKRVSPGLKTDCLLQPCKIQRRIRSNYMGPTLEEGSGCATGDTKQSSTLGVWEEPPRAGLRLSTSQWPQVADFGQRQKSKHLALMYKIVHGEVAVTPGLLGLQRPDSKTRASDCINSANSQGGLKNLFANKTIWEWNHLLAELVEADSLPIFRSWLSVLADTLARWAPSSLPVPPTPREASWPQRPTHSAHTLHCRDIRARSLAIKIQINMTWSSCTCLFVPYT